MATIDHNFGNSISSKGQNLFTNVESGRSTSEVNSMNVWDTNNKYRTSYFNQSLYNVSLENLFLAISIEKFNRIIFRKTKS